MEAASRSLPSLSNHIKQVEAVEWSVQRSGRDRRRHLDGLDGATARQSDKKKVDRLHRADKKRDGQCGIRTRALSDQCLKLAP